MRKDHYLAMYCCFSTYCLILQYHYCKNSSLGLSFITLYNLLWCEELHGNQLFLDVCVCIYVCIRDIVKRTIVFCVCLSVSLNPNFKLNVLLSYLAFVTINSFLLLSSKWRYCTTLINIKCSSVSGSAIFLHISFPLASQM